ncbi:hypothetical protein BIW11_09645 [Tropilaelaps mercedesae]|uniref:Uncharacterized protein n=1 Tax=Tropilaelaps mercedesae TaxID=418985 RepID=A0A1V9XJF2_9ACAR|nr:hypothetical protein BIW11_09645 [Tropilaelaps mercedesae]
MDQLRPSVAFRPSNLKSFISSGWPFDHCGHSDGCKRYAGTLGHCRLSRPWKPQAIDVEATDDPIEQWRDGVDAGVVHGSGDYSCDGKSVVTDQHAIRDLLAFNSSTASWDPFELFQDELASLTSNGTSSGLSHQAGLDTTTFDRAACLPLPNRESFRSPPTRDNQF